MAHMGSRNCLFQTFLSVSFIIDRPFEERDHVHDLQTAILYAGGRVLGSGNCGIMEPSPHRQTTSTS
jgi:hypothetical protein